MNEIIIDTKVTETWGVEWDEMETARDFLQNFYDANKDENNNVDNIKIDILSNNIVNVYGPVIFDYQELIYLTSSKVNDNTKIGQYGEGWKASVLNTLRNWNCGVTFITKDKKLRYYFENKIIGEKSTRVVFCEVSDCEPINGSMLTITNCNSKLMEEFKFGLNYFYHEKNTLFKNNLISNYERNIIIYESSDTKSGYIFYKKLLRAKIDIPIVVVCNKEYKDIENRIKHDRDRKAFNQEVLEKLLKLVFRNFSNTELSSTLELLKFWWDKGHKILSIISETRKYNDRFVIKFLDDYYAKESRSSASDLLDNNLQIEIENVKKEFQELGYILCPHYMSSFGMKTPDSIARKRLDERQKRLNNTYSRDLDISEKTGINILSEFIKKLSLDLYKRFENAKYTIGENDEIIGELKKKRTSGQQHIFLNKVFFELSFSDSLAILLHEWAHIYGYDGARTFSDALTSFISLILGNQNILNEVKIYENQWNNIVQMINKNRGVKEINSVYKTVEKLTNEEMIKILKKIPEEELFKLLSNIK